jgi:hypothetical protein
LNSRDFTANSPSSKPYHKRTKQAFLSKKAWNIADYIPIEDEGNDRRARNLYAYAAAHYTAKKVLLYGRWEIQREGKKGPFGGIEEAIIP